MTTQPPTPPPATPPAPATPPPAPAGVQTVPYARFQTLVGERNDLRSQIENLNAQVQGLTEKGATVDTLTQANTALQGELKSEQGRFSRFSTIASHGLTDPQAVEAVEWQYGKLRWRDVYLFLFFPDGKQLLVQREYGRGRRRRDV